MKRKRQSSKLLALTSALLVTLVVAQRAQYGAVPYGVEIRSCTRPNMVALTFDDGPSHLTPDLLDLLDKRGVRATFFLNGNNMGKGPITDKSLGHGSVIRRMYQSGHQIGSHTWSHKDFNEISDEQRWDELVELEVALLDIIRVYPTYFRAPWGRCNEGCQAMLSEFGYHLIQWDLDTNDWKQDEQASRDTFSQTLNSQNSAIVLAHDIHEMTVNSLAAYMISTARAKGFSLVTVGECLGDPRRNWYRTAGSSSKTKTNTKTNTNTLRKQWQKLQEGSSSTTPASSNTATRGSMNDLSATPSVGLSVSTVAGDSDASKVTQPSSAESAEEADNDSGAAGLMADSALAFAAVVVPVVLMHC
ncbi:uncharacterized protein F5Z01DRAFT_622178 [Emericellopsis atlantica]|uniref:NodB homology domain-containing protein n=1 Tax=Emericellopsis atlantica TaxID=2614577 RepID=A0A9P8CR10_9HYPO|nr:uncharacterized protein F5Z01DRAFT_622178 [Emericellopsis atlantica]KAG9254266.1 hypothetical protein F5Z01DRAFT_622178 [Emericellopsis atlantica]